MPTTQPHEAPLDTACEDRRGAERHPSGQDACCHPASNLDTTPVQVKDVSTHGVGLVSARRFEPGTVLVLELAETALQPVSVLARVVRIVPRTDGRWLIGCVFLSEVSDEEFIAFRAERHCRAGSVRRTGVAVPAHRVAVCRLVGVGALGRWTAEVRDVSPEEVGLVLAVAVEPGVQLRLEMSPEGAEAPRTQLVKVLRRESQPDGRWLLGCQVIATPPRVPVVAAAARRKK